MNPTESAWPVLILVRPEIPENLGFIARTMQCFGLTHWRIVGSDHLNLQPGSAAWKTSSGAESLLSACERMPSLEEAVSDCHEVWGFSRRAHGSSTLELLGEKVMQLPRPSTKRMAWVFGPESQGLSGQDAPFVQHWVRIETSHPTMSLNLSHAVAIALHAWQTRIQKDIHPEDSLATLPRHEDLPALAERGLMEKGWTLLEQAIRNQRVFPESKEEAQVQHLRRLWNRMALTRGEGEFLMGTAKVLLQGRQPRPKRHDSGESKS